MLRRRRAPGLASRVAQCAGAVGSKGVRDSIRQWNAVLLSTFYVSGAVLTTGRSAGSATDRTLAPIIR